MLSFLENIKKYWIFFAAIIGIIIFAHLFKSCGPDVPKIIVDKPVKVVAPSTFENSIVPAGTHATGSFVVKVPTPRRFDRIDTRVVIAAGCNTCPAQYIPYHKIKAFLGFSFEPKIFLGYIDKGPILAYNQTIFRYSRSTLDILVGIPVVGGGIGFNLTNNFYVFGGVGLKYLEYDDISKIGIYRPIFGAGFAF